MHLIKQLDSLGTVITIAAGNSGPNEPTNRKIPQAMLEDIDNLILVGWTDFDTSKHEASQQWDPLREVLVYAQGSGVWTSVLGDVYDRAYGSSMGKLQSNV